MVTVETIGKVRHAYVVKKHGIKRIARDLRLSRNTGRLVVRANKPTDGEQPSQGEARQ